MKNKLFAFTRIGFARVVASSLILALYFLVVVVNFASGEMSGGNFVWTLLLIGGITLFICYSKEKNHTPLVSISRVWMIITFVVCLVGAVLSIMQIELDGIVGAIAGFLVIAFISPYYGFGFIINKSIAVCIFGCISSGFLFFLPMIIDTAKKKKKLKRKYR